MMTSFETTVSKIKGALDQNAPVDEFNSLMLSDMAMSLALIADRMEGGESATSPGDEKKDPEGSTQEWRVIDKEAPVPVSWIEKEIEFLKSQDNEFAGLAASNISGMLNKWKDEQNGKDDKQDSGDK